MRNRINRLIVLFGVAITASPALGQTPPALKTIAPFVDETTFLVIRVDTTKLDTGSIIQQIGKWASIDENKQQQMTVTAEMALRAIKHAGGDQFYVGMSLDDGWTEPFVVIPASGDDSLKAVQGLLRTTLRKAEAIKHHQAIIIGSKRSLQRIREMKAQVPAPIATEFSSKDPAAIRGVLWIPPVLRQALKETAPGLPGIGGGDLAKPLLQGWSRISFALDAKPKQTFRVTVHAHTEQTAESIEQVLGGVLVHLRKQPRVKEQFDEFGKLIPILRPNVDGKELRWSFDEHELAMIFTPMLNRQRQAAQRQVTHNKLRQIGIAMHSYYDVHKLLPPPANVDNNGKPLLSWRVHLLPYLDEVKLYKQFRLDEPWDSPHNKKLISQMPKVYESAIQSTKREDQYKTRFLAPVGKNAIFFGKKGTSIRDITDGTSNTIMVVEASEEQAAIWTKPSDLPMDTKDLKKALCGPKGKHFMCVFADGSSRVIMRAIDDRTLNALFTRNGGEAVNFP